MTSADRVALGVTPSSEGDRVTTLELFFDLVFVFAFTQVTALLAHGEMPRTLLHGALALSLLWFAWSAYSWLANQARANRGALQAAFIVAMIAMFVASMVVPEAFHEVPGGVPAAGLLVACYAVVRLAHLAFYFVAAGTDVGLRQRLVITAATSVAPTVGLLAIGAVVGEPNQTWIWLGAVVYDFVAIYVGARGGGWALQSAKHFAERHGLVVILALGESIVAIGVGIAGETLDWQIIAGAVLAISVAVCLWWLYFHRRLDQLEHAVAARHGKERALLATEVFTYLHFPIIAGIIVVAMGIEQTMAHLSDTHLGDRGGWALAGGLAALLAASAATIIRATGTWPLIRLVGCAVLLAAGPLLAVLEPLAALALVVVLLTALCVSEELGLRAQLPQREVGSGVSTNTKPT